MEKVFTNEQHVLWLREQAAMKRPYWYGVYHLKCSERLLNRKKKQYPTHYTADRMARYRADIAAGQVAGDCVNGAIKGAVWSELGAREPVYCSHGCPDKSADGMFDFCKKLGMEWGEMDQMPDLPGIAVRMKGHVGVYVGKGEVVEWRGFRYGCVVTRLTDRKWLNWYRLPWTEYVEAAPDQSAPGGAAGSLPGMDGDSAGSLPETGGAAGKPGAFADFGALGTRLLTRGMTGEDVRTLQELLVGLGYRLEQFGADGQYGRETEQAVRAFQSANGLDADGKYGAKSHAAMKAAWNGTAESPGEEAPFQVMVTGGAVFIRSGASAEHDVIAVVRYGDLLPATKRAENGWYCVRAHGKVGWIGPRYAEKRSAV